MIELKQGDCLDILKTIPDNSVDLVVTDPPYEVHTEAGGGSVNLVKHLNKSLGELDRDNISDGYKFEEINQELIRVMKDINIYIWYNKVQIPKYIDLYVNQLNCKFDILTWHKSNAMPTFSNKYLTDTEYCLYFHNGAGKTFPKSYEDAQTYWIYPINMEDKKYYEHPTIKPLHMIERLVKNSSKENDIVLDCFMGSGTTGVACKKLNRNFIGIELNPKYYEIAKKRIDEPLGVDLW